MRNAIKIGRYLTEHARAAFAEMGTDEQLENAKRLLRWIERTETRKFTRRESHQAHRSRFKTVDEIDPALDLLESHNYIRVQADNSDKRPGRKASQAYDVNPFLFHSERATPASSYRELTREDLRKAALDPEEWRRLEAEAERSAIQQ